LAAEGSENPPFKPETNKYAKDSSQINPLELLFFCLQPVKSRSTKKYKLYLEVNMRTMRLILVIAMLLGMIFLVGTASAGNFTYTSGIQVQNLDNTQASVQLRFFNQDGSTENTVNDTIPANGSKTYFPLNQVSEGFNGSVVISSENRVAAVSNIHGNNFSANASFIASSTGSPDVSIPLLMKGNSGFDTWFNVQNTASSGDASVTIDYSDGTSASATVKPGAAHTFDQSTENHSATVFSATVDSSQPVAVTVIEEDARTMFAYNGFPAASTNPVMPLINENNSGYTTGVQIQNTGNQQTQVTVSYTPAGAGQACTETQTIQANRSATFALRAFTGSAQGENCAQARFVGSARVTANSNDMPLVAVVNQHVLGLNGEAYGAFDPDAATSTVVLPLIMDRNSGYWTGFNVMNVGSQQTTVSCDFTNTNVGVPPTQLGPGRALNALQDGRIASGYIGSATCTASGGGKIIAVVNELGPSGSLDQLLVYEGINVAPSQ
jgi:hypothetical protein